MSEQVRCPECGEEYSRPGLHGHLRFAHGMDTEKANEAYEKATGQAVRGHRGKPKKEPTQLEVIEDEETAEEDRAEPRGRETTDERDTTENRSAPPVNELRKQYRESRRERDPEEKRREARERAVAALERLRKAKSRLSVAEEETPEVSRSGVDRLLYGAEKHDDVGMCEICEEEVDRAREEYHRAVEELRVMQQETGEK